MDAANYRIKARELRAKARNTLGQSECAHLLTMADEYDWLAARAEAKKRETEENQRPTRGSR
jgi:hypothetical protein